MSDIFLSYARSTETQAQRVAEALRALGYGVWRDDELPAHRPYSEVIEERLKAARAVVVIWSAEALRSHWVRAEADAAREAGTLVQLSVDGTTPPMPFNQIQCADLVGWVGGADAPGWRKVVASIADLVGRKPRKPSPASAPGVATPRLAVDEPRSGPEAAWANIEASLDPRDYADFLEVFPHSEQAFEARRHRRKLEDWAATDQADLASVTALLRSGLFAALQTIVQAKADTLAGSAERARLLSVPARANASDARAAALSGRAAQARSFGIDLPGVAAWPRPVMVAVPPGRFVMGSPDDEERQDDLERDGEEGPQHEVKIDHVFAMGRGAVTVDAFRAFVAHTNHDMGESAVIEKGDKWEDTPGRGWRDPGFAQAGDHPVTCVNWHDARAFIAWLNDQLNLTDRPDAYRLPSEAEWEYACRAGATTAFSFGATITTDQANFNGTAGYGGAPPSTVWRRATTPLGRFAANAFGLYDMHGDTWDWCADAWNPTYEGAPTDGAAWLTGDASLRLLRGGCWYASPQFCRSALRYRGNPTRRASDFGFRLARTLSPAND